MTRRSLGLLRRPVAAALICLSVAALGLWSGLALPIAELPAVDLPTVVVTATLPGADPQTMAARVAAPLEKRLARMSGMTELTSNNVAGASQITVQFGLGKSIDGAVSDTQAAIDAARAELPRDSPGPPVLTRVNPAMVPIIFLAATSDTVPAGQLYELIERIVAQPLARLEGVGHVSIQGGQRPAVRLQADPAELAARGLALADVRRAVENADGNGPKGAFGVFSSWHAIAGQSQLSDAKAYAGLPLVTADGALARIGDVARASDGVADERVAGWYNDKRALFVLIQRDANANIVGTAARVTAALPQLIRWLPDSVKLEVVADRTFKIKDALRESLVVLAVSILCVIAIMLLGLRDMRSALIAAVAIPLSLLATLGVMHVIGYGLDIISLTALTVSIGFVVDDAIVMVENVMRHREAGLGRLRATIKGAREVRFTIVSITVSLIAALLPLVLVPGVVGTFLRQFSVTLIVAILISGALSLTLTPIMCANLLPDGGPAGASRLSTWRDRIAARCLAHYERSLLAVLAWPRLSLVITLALSGLTILLYANVPKGFLPSQDTGIIAGYTLAGPDLSFAAMSDRQRSTTRIILADPAVANVTSYIGAAAGTAAGSGRLFVTLKPRAERPPLQEVMQRLRLVLAPLPDVTTFLRPVDDVVVGGREGRGRYQFTLQGENWAILDRYHRRVLAHLAGAPQLVDLSSDQRIGALQAILTVDRDRAGLMGLAASDVEQSLYDAFGQRRAAVFSEGFGQRAVIIESLAQGQDAAQMRRVYAATPMGDAIGLDAVTSSRIASAPAAITHQNQFPSVTLFFNLAPGAALSDGLGAIRGAIAELGLPSGVRASFEGTAGAFAASSQSQPWLILAAVLTIYLVLGILYESFVHPITILSSLPFAGLGAVLAAIICGTEFTILSFVGLVLVLGIVKKNAIILVDFAIAAERQSAVSPEEAILQACRQRIRPILMTTLTALAGALPLAFDAGAGAEMRRSFGVVVVGGLIASQAMTLYLTPLIYLFMARLGRRWRLLSQSGPGWA